MAHKQSFSHIENLISKEVPNRDVPVFGLTGGGEFLLSQLKITITTELDLKYYSFAV